MRPTIEFFKELFESHKHKKQPCWYRNDCPHDNIRSNMSTLECPVFIKYYPNLPKDCEFSQYCKSTPTHPQPKPIIIPKIKKRYLFA